MRKGDLVYLRWEDPRGWEPLGDAQNGVPSIIESVGWVMMCGHKLAGDGCSRLAGLLVVGSHFVPLWPIGHA